MRILNPLFRVGPAGRSPIALLLILAACGWLSAACGGAPKQEAHTDKVPPPVEPLVRTLPTVGRYGGRFVLGETSGPKTFNGLMASETSSTDITYELFKGLTSFDKTTQKDTPLLASFWELGTDGLTWTFHLRKGLAFSDGHPLTADDVLFSFAVAQDPTLHPSVQDLLTMDGKPWAVSSPDPLTVVVKTPGPNAMVPSLIGDVRILPKHILEPAYKAGTFASAYNVSTPPAQLVTSGPWVVKQYVPNEKTVLARNPYWFGVDQQGQRLPYLNELVFLVVPDQDAADLKFRAGELDGLENVKPENYAYYEAHQQEGNYTLHTLGPRLATNFFWFNLNPVRKAAPGKTVGTPQVGAMKYAWFNNPVFRRAVSMAVDRDAIIKSVFLGHAVKNWSQSLPNIKDWYYPGVKKYDYDLPAAKALLAGLGWKDRNGDGVIEDDKGNAVTFTLKTNGDNRLRVAMANFIRDDLAKLGIKAVLTPVDFNTLVTNLHDDFQYDAILLGLQSGVPPDPGMGQNVWRSSGRSHNWNVEQPKPETPQEVRIDALMDVIVSSPELPVRQKAWNEVQDIVNEQAWQIWLPTQLNRVPVSNRFGNMVPTALPHVLVRDIETVYVKATDGAR